MNISKRTKKAATTKIDKNTC